MIENHEKNCEWHFAEQTGGREDGPNDPKLENFKQYAYPSLVREAIQNSLDAVDDDTKPVEVSFNIEEIDTTCYKNLFLQLSEHVAGCLQYYSSNKDAKRIYGEMSKTLFGFRGLIQYIKISDSNTIGMDYVENDTDSPFYAFVRSAGVTSKATAQAGGSFGFGKAAYFNISPISTVFVSTHTKKGRCWFEGVSSLCTHLFRAKKCVAVGYYDNNEGNPISSPMQIPQQFRKECAGTDFYILGINAKENQDRVQIYSEIKEAVLRHFWLSIYENKLVVKIGSEVINKLNLENHMKRVFVDPEDTTKKFSFYNPLPYLDAVAHAGVDSRHILVSKRLLGLGDVRLFVKKSKLAPDKMLYMRAPRMLVYGKKNQSSYGYYGVFVCDDRQGNALLRNMENPAHNEWSDKNWQINGKPYFVGKDVLDELKIFITKTIQDIFANNVADTLKIKGLDQYLYIPTEVEADEDDESESYSGAPQGTFQESGTSMTTDSTDSEGAISVTSSNGNEGTVSTGPIGKGVSSSSGTERAGGSSGKKRTGKTKTGEKTQGSSSSGSISTKGQKDLYQEIPIRYRSFAQQPDKAILHVLVIHSEKAITNARIAVVIAGEEEDSTIEMISSNPGTIAGNEIINLNLEKGKNTIVIHFKDNYKHSIKLIAYEPV